MNYIAILGYPRNQSVDPQPYYVAPETVISANSPKTQELGEEKEAEFEFVRACKLMPKDL